MLLQTFPRLRKYRHGSKFLWPEHDQGWTGLLGAARVPGRGQFFGQRLHVAQHGAFQNIGTIFQLIGVPDLSCSWGVGRRLSIEEGMHY